MMLGLDGTIAAGCVDIGLLNPSIDGFSASSMSQFLHWRRVKFCEFIRPR